MQNMAIHRENILKPNKTETQNKHLINVYHDTGSCQSLSESLTCHASHWAILQALHQMPLSFNDLGPNILQSPHATICEVHLLIMCLRIICHIPGEHDVLLPLGRRSRPSAVEICHGEDLQSAIHYKVPCAMDIAIGNMPSPGHCWQVCMWICSAYQLLLANILNICQDNNKNLGKQSSTHKNKSVWGPWPCGPPEGHPTFASASIFKKDNVLHPRCMEPNEEMASSCQECHGDTG